MAGRPKGSKNTGKITAELINQAKVMYIGGKSIPEIQKILGMTSSNTLYRHMEKGKWQERREAFMASNTNNQLSTMMSNALAETARMADDLKIFRDRAIDGIETGTLKPTKFGEAGNIYIAAAEMERKIRSEALHLTFIEEVAKILRRHIQDQDMLIAIAADMRQLFEKKRKELEAPEA